MAKLMVPQVQLMFTEIGRSTKTINVNAGAGWVQWDISAVASEGQVAEIMGYANKAGGGAWGVRTLGSALDTRGTCQQYTYMTMLVRVGAGGKIEIYDVSAVGGEANTYQVLGVLQ